MDIGLRSAPAAGGSNLAGRTGDIDVFAHLGPVHVVHGADLHLVLYVQHDAKHAPSADSLQLSEERLELHCRVDPRLFLRASREAVQGYVLSPDAGQNFQLLRRDPY